ncbi:hypothetical protein GT347_04915 [Xylophilus rhododendri]|uniref:Uncharacterized protein n=1 Tax=Xylophilus rhododendri TaxID=2697032 RepID=A0A857J2V2_9BURK|nr:hypothetical protein [Xylophilus rhododendri]QHI97381.1 hypothetical protein GT347_04915 [Xylophilus rhododendri]
MSAAVFWSAWLAAAWWCLAPLLGATVLIALNRLTGGAWGQGILPAAQALARRLPRVLLLWLPLVFGLRALYPFLQGPDWLHGVERPGFLQVWFAPWFFVARGFAYALAAWMLARPAALATAGQGRAAATLIAYLLLGSLAAVDAIGGLMPRWHSSVFALTLLAGQLIAGIAACTWLSLRAGRPLPGRDLGNLLLMAVMLWAYLGFMQLLIIWAENLPREITWYLPRLLGGWSRGGVALLLLQFVLPLVLLLFRAVKDHPARLLGVAGLAWAAQLLDAAWQTLPSVVPASGLAVVLVPLLAAPMAWLAYGGIVKELRHGPR